VRPWAEELLGNYQAGLAGLGKIDQRLPNIYIRTNLTKDEGI